MDFEQNGAQAPDAQESTPPEQLEEQRPLRDFKSVNPVKPVRTRRVGTLTMGAALIVTGVLLLVNAVVPDFPLYMAARFSPVILVLVGVEILAASLRGKGEKLRYDFLSMIVCFILISGSLLLGTVPQYVENMARIDETESRLSRELEEDVYEALRGQGIERLSVGFYFYDNLTPWSDPFPSDLSYSDADGAYLSINVTLSGMYDGKEEFAAAVRDVLDALEPLDLPSDASLYIDDAGYDFSASVYRIWEWDYTEEQIADNLVY